MRIALDDADAHAARGQERQELFDKGCLARARCGSNDGYDGHAAHEVRRSAARQAKGGGRVHVEKACARANGNVKHGKRGGRSPKAALTCRHSRREHVRRFLVVERGKRLASSFGDGHDGSHHALRLGQKFSRCVEGEKGHIRRHGEGPSMRTRRKAA